MVEFNKEYKTKNGDKAVIFGRIKDKLIGFMETSGGHILAWHWKNIVTTALFARQEGSGMALWFGLLFVG